MRLRHRQQLGVALVAPGAFAVHQLRYELALRSAGSRGLTGHQHADLHRLLPLVVLTLALYIGQELTEGLITAGHQLGPAAILGGGGLLALPASIAVGGLLALVVRGSRALVALLVLLRGRRPRAVAARGRQVVVRRASLALPRLAPLAAAFAGRAPPARALLGL